MTAGLPLGVTQGSAGSMPAARPVQRRGSILVVDDDEMILALVSEGLVRAGFDVTTADSGLEALRQLAEAVPDLVVSDVNMPDMNGFELVAALRGSAALRHVPLVFLTTRSDTGDVLEGLRLGSDDYLTKPFDLAVLVARVSSKLNRPPVPADHISYDRRSGLVGGAAITAVAQRERDRAARSSRGGHVAVLDVDELASVRLRFGNRAVDELARQIGSVLQTKVTALEVAGRDETGRFVLVLPETAEQDVSRRLQLLTEELAASGLSAGGEHVHITPLVGFAELSAGGSGSEAVECAALALESAREHLDLRPVAYDPRMLQLAQDRAAGKAPRSRPGLLHGRGRTPFQIALTLVIGLVLPYLLYFFADRAGFDITPVMYVVVVVALFVTGVAIWIEGVLAQNPVQPRLPHDSAEAQDRAHAPASAIIAAYLPNEAATIIETVEAFQRVDYPGGLQIVVAYNTPRDLPVEIALGQLAQRDPRLVVLRVAGSTSKAQNVNAALGVCTGRMIGVFDADHHPEPDAFRRAWRWLDEGYDIVQGHPVVRNGDASWVSRLVAVEFEMIYGVSHPGRARLHGFGIFGGSNGYWRSDLLRMTRMRGSMLTEDIDSSLRVVEAGYRIASDPYLVSRELAPTTLQALWNQRMRWAQGWFQVSLGHLTSGWTSRNLTPRQRLGFTFLLGWREVYPWLSFQMFPIVAFYSVKAGGPGHLDWFVPVFVLTTLFTTAVGPWQALFAYRRAHPDIKAHRRWFVSFLFLSMFWYTEYKNCIGRTAQIKQLMREKTWKVTPRAVGTASPVEGTLARAVTDPGANDPDNHPARVVEPADELTPAAAAGRDLP
jgi:cellulose synthase/poly-beta-1,6-N-acetylglucosamine synthase-like glycosyltransferase/DNA-binding response OmpR family regulator